VVGLYNQKYKIAYLNRESTKSEDSKSKSIPLSVYQKIKKKIGYKTVSSLKRFGMTYLASIQNLILLQISYKSRCQVKQILLSRTTVYNHEGR